MEVSRLPIKSAPPHDRINSASEVRKVPTERIDALPAQKTDGQIMSFAADHKEVVKARLIGGSVVRVCRGNIVGFCHIQTHPGKLTKNLLREHECLEKKCPFLEKYEDSPFWIDYQRRCLARSSAKQNKKKKKIALDAEAALLSDLRVAFQMCADFTDSPMDVIRVDLPNPWTYRIFYISDNRFADGNRFPEFLEVMREKYHHHRIILRHIKDVDGHFVTRDEYYRA